MSCRHQVDDNEQVFFARQCSSCIVRHMSVRLCCLCHVLICANCKFDAQQQQQPSWMMDESIHQSSSMVQIEQKQEQTTTFFHQNNNDLSRRRYVPLVFAKSPYSFTPDVNPTREFLPPDNAINSNITARTAIMDDATTQNLHYKPQEHYMTWNSFEQQNMADSVLAEEKRLTEQFKDQPEKLASIKRYNISVRPSMRILRAEYEQKNDGVNMPFSQWVNYKLQLMDTDSQQMPAKLNDPVFQKSYSRFKEVKDYYALFANNELSSFTFEQLQDRIIKVTEQATYYKQNHHRAAPRNNHKNQRPVVAFRMESRYNTLREQVMSMYGGNTSNVIATPSTTLVTSATATSMKRKLPDPITTTTAGATDRSRLLRSSKKTELPAPAAASLPPLYQFNNNHYPKSPLLPYSPQPPLTFANLSSSSSALKIQSSAMAMLSSPNHSPNSNNYPTDNNNNDEMSTDPMMSMFPAPSLCISPVSQPITIVPVEAVEVVPSMKTNIVRNARMRRMFPEDDEDEENDVTEALTTTKTQTTTTVTTKQENEVTEVVLQSGGRLYVPPSIPTITNSEQVKLLCQRFACRFISPNQLVLVLNCIRLVQDDNNLGTFTQMDDYLDHVNLATYRQQQIANQQLHMLQNLYLVLETPPLSSLSMLESTHPHELEASPANHSLLSKDEFSMEHIDRLHLYYRDQDALVQKILKDKDDNNHPQNLEIPLIVIPALYPYTADRRSRNHFVSIVIEYLNRNVYVVDSMSSSYSSARVRYHPNITLIGHLGNLLRRIAPHIDDWTTHDPIYLGIQEDVDGLNCGAYQVWFTKMLSEIVKIDVSKSAEEEASRSTRSSRGMMTTTSVSKDDPENRLAKQIKIKAKQILQERVVRLQQQQQSQQKKKKREDLEILYDYYSQLPSIFRLDMDYLLKMFRIVPSTILKKDMDIEYKESLFHMVETHLTDYVEKFRVLSFQRWKEYKKHHWTNHFITSLQSVQKPMKLITNEIQQAKLINNIHHQLYDMILKAQESNTLASNEELAKQFDQEEPTTSTTSKQSSDEEPTSSLWGIDAERAEYEQILLNSVQFHRL